LTPMVQCLLEGNDLTPAELSELESLIKAKKADARRQPPTSRTKNVKFP